VAGAVNVNPGANTVLAQTSSLTGGQYAFKIVVWSTVIVDVILERRNAANNANVSSQNLAITSRMPPPFEFEFTVSESETIRLELVQAITGGGQIQASIFYRRVS